ncbi:MAG TPA: hypothetical protein VHB46_18200 [Burkholderiales bacterium]|nr:hypothetical protein [Burkholderiales bacterium]
MNAFCKRGAFALVAILLTLVVGCAQPIRNVSGAPVVTSTKSPSMNAIGEAIKQAGMGLGWVMTEQSPGKIIGTLNLRTHQAVVAVTYDATSYNINYVDSHDLKYDAQKGTIHRNYNGWIQNLNNAIQTRLSII